MNWLKCMNDTIDFIEDNIDQDINGEDIEKVSFVSYHHFLRMFMFLSGLNLSEYIRKRKLSLAAMDIISTNEKIIDIGFKYGYSTPESFSKAFKKYHEVSPSILRKQKHSVKSFPKLSFQVVIEGGKEVEYKIVKKGNLNFIGYSKSVSTVDGENFKVIPAMWQEIMTDGRFQRLISQADELGIVGICYDWVLEEQSFKYMIGIRNTGQEIDGTIKVDFEDDVFAEFKAVGKLPDSIQRTTNFIYQEWFPSSNYQHSGGPELEVYTHGDTNSEDYVSYYLVPVKQKK